MSAAMLEQEQQFDAGAVEGIDQSTVEQSGPQYPTIQWHYGDAKAKKAGGMAWQGGWFVKADQVDEATMLAAGWAKEEWTHDSGASEEGFYRRELAVSVIATRKRWEVAGDGPRQLFPWSQYETATKAGRPSGRTHVLVLVKGLESVGPMVLTLKGSAAMGFEGGRNSAGALTKFGQTVIRAANMASDAAAKKAGKAAGKHWPYRAFWLPVGADRTAAGEPNFTEVGKDKNTKRVVLPVALGLPDKAENVALNRFYVGAELLDVVNNLLIANDEWVKAWENIVPGATENGATTGANGDDVADEVETPDAKVLAETGL